LVQRAPLADRFVLDPEVRIAPTPSDAWLAGFATLSPVAPAHRETMIRMLRSIAAPVGFARVENKGQPVAFALGVVDGDHVGLFDVLVAPQARRRGLARRLTQSIGGPRARRALLLFAGGGDGRRCTVALCRSWVRDGLQLRLPRAIVRTGERTMSSYVWEKSYPPGVKWELEVPRKTIHQIFEESCAQNADRPFTDFLDKVMTFGDYKDATDRAAAGFQKFGVGPGVNVGLYLPNTPHYLIAFFGILKAGGRVVNYSPLDAARELEFKIGDS